MHNEIEVIADSNGVAVLGDENAVERFMDATGLTRVPASRVIVDVG